MQTLLNGTKCEQYDPRQWKLTIEFWGWNEAVEERMQMRATATFKLLGTIGAWIYWGIMFSGYGISRVSRSRQDWFSWESLLEDVS